jgi:uncharacterized protein (TIGR03437 family)
MKPAAFSVAMLFALSASTIAQTPIVNSVVSQASSTTPVSPGMPVVLNGTNLAGGNTNCPGPKVPLSCGSVTVTVNGRSVPVRYASPTQVGAYVPVDQAPGQASVVITNHQGQSSAPFSVSVELYAPGIQKLSDAGGTIGLFSDQSQRIVNRTNPAVPGQELTVYAVGLGPTTPTVPTGEVLSAPVTTLPTLWLGNRTLPVLFAGLGCGAFCEPGTYMVRFPLPPDTPSGEQPAYLEIAGKRSNAGILVVGGTSTAAGPSIGYLQSMFDASVRAMSPGALANVVGGGFLSSPGALSPCTMEPNVWPTKCQGVTVTINGRPAAIQLVTTNFMTIQVPYEVSPGPATLTVERSTDSQVLKSNSFSFTLDAYSPTLPVNLPSPYAGIIIANSGGPASQTNPLLPGDIVNIYATGLGQTNPPMATGFAQIQPVRMAVTPSVTVGGKPLDGVVAEVLQGMIGQCRITAKVPTGLGTGDLPIVVEIGGKKSQAGLLVPVSDKAVIAAVTNSASALPEISSGSWVTIYGRNLSATTRSWSENDIIYDWLPTTLDGVDVAVNNISAVVAYVSPMQLNVLAPDNLPTGPVEVIVKSPLGWQKSTVNVKQYAPALFPLGVQPGQYLLAMHANWTYVARPGMLPPNVESRPAQPGETIVFYGTGFGRTTPDVTIRKRFSGSAPLLSTVPVRVQIGTAQAQVTYVGLVGNGLYQMNLVVPALADGDHEVIVTMGTESSPRGRFIPVQR